MRCHVRDDFHTVCECSFFLKFGIQNRRIGEVSCMYNMVVAQWIRCFWDSDGHRARSPFDDNCDQYNYVEFDKQAVDEGTVEPK